MTLEQNRIFEKYCINYGFENNDKRESVLNKIKRQKEIFKILEEESNDDARNGIKELIEDVKSEIEHQYIRKEHVENRMGFIMALWGIVVASALTTYNDACKGTIKPDRITVLFLVELILGIVSLIVIAIGLRSIEIRHFDFSDRKTNYYCAATNINMFHVRELEILTNVWERNEKKINNKVIVGDVALFLTFMFIISVIVVNIAVK